MRSLFIGILLATTLTACANVSRLQRESLVAFGEQLDGASAPLYYLIRLDLKKSANARTTSFFLKLSPDSPAIAFSDLRPELVARYLPPFTPPKEWPEFLKEKAKKDVAYAGGGFHITFENNRPTYIGICSHCNNGREYPTVGTPDGQHLYTLPLTEQQLSEVFGSPDRVYKVSEVRY